MSMPIDSASTVYAAELTTQSGESYVENIEIYTTAAATEHLRGYEFSKQVMNYEVTFPDNRAGAAPFKITIPSAYVKSHKDEAQLYCQFCLDGVELKLNNQAKMFPLFAETTSLYQMTALAAGKMKNEGV